MSVSYTPLEGSCTADAEDPFVEYNRGMLMLRFVDWRKRAITIRFPDTIAFRWQEEAELPPEIRDDAAYEVQDSPWIAELAARGLTSSDTKHFKLCFNAAGVLDVVSGQLALDI